MVSFFGKSNRLLIEQELAKGGIHDSQIVECDLENLKSSNVSWIHTDIRDSHLNNAEFFSLCFEQSSFFRSSFVKAEFIQSSFTGMAFDGLTLIKSGWQNCKILDSVLQNSCLQRTTLKRLNLIASSLTDFEALEATMEDCFVAHSRFSITYASGMNGFSGGSIKNCIFYNCYFEGFPLRGASVESSVFVHCRGEIGDEMDCCNVAGLGLRGRARVLPLGSAVAARTLLERFEEA
jgi:uncharacterized protein YjbI with pentapeptide repeats